MAANSKDFGRIIKQQRIAAGLTLRKLSDVSGVSSSHLGRIERGERFPSAYILQRIAKPLGFDESELFALAGYLSNSLSAEADMTVVDTAQRLDPLVARMLAQESVEVQRAVIALLNLLKSLARTLE
jgi:transcriptional regulator with XRE-family HTH domain